MSKEIYFNKLKELPEPIKQFGGLVLITIIIILSFTVLNKMFGQGDELVKKNEIRGRKNCKRKET